jgi:hypothetical protein
MGNGSVMARSEHLDQWFTHAEIGKGLVCSNFGGLSASARRVAAK